MSLAEIIQAMECKFNPRPPKPQSRIMEQAYGTINALGIWLAMKEAPKASVSGRLASFRHRLQGLAAKTYPWGPVAAWAVLIYLLINFREPGAVSAAVDMYAVQPLLWLSLAVTGWVGFRYGIAVRPRLTRHKALMALLVGGFQVSLFVLAGLAFGFGHSPYGHSPPVLLGNLYYAGAILLGMEVSRGCIIAALGKRRPLLAVTTATLFFALLGIPVARWASIRDVGALLRVSGATLLPAVSESLLASFLSLLGGPGASIAYRGVLQLFEWASPILPDLSWQMSAFLGTVAPSLGLVILWNETMREAPADAEAKPRGVRLGVAWVMVAVVAVSLLWLNTGLFGVQPTLVAGASMTPALNTGDVALVRQVPPQSVEVGDIIRFRLDGVYVLHRVVAIEEVSSGLQFITRGDANNVEDPPVLAGQLQGRVVLVVPKIGWVGIGARKVFDWIGGLW